MWKFITDEEWSDVDREAIASFLVPFRESKAGTATATAQNDDDEPIKSYALARVKDREVGVVVDHRTGSIVWAYGGKR